MCGRPMSFTFPSHSITALWTGPSERLLAMPSSAACRTRRPCCFRISLPKRLPWLIIKIQPLAIPKTFRYDARISFPPFHAQYEVGAGGPMLAKLNTFALVGIEAVPVEVEVDASAGLPKTVLVGLPEMAVKESIHRIERALANLGYERHPGRTVINLAPADLPKNAGAFDLPIALGLLVATGQLLPEQMRDYATVGELALDGSVRPVKGALAMAMDAAERGIAKLLVP